MRLDEDGAFKMHPDEVGYFEMRPRENGAWDIRSALDPHAQAPGCACR